MFWWILYSTVEMDFWRKHPFEQGNKLVNRPSDSMGWNRKSVSFENRIQSSRFVLLFVVWAFVLSAKQTTDFCLSLRTSFFFFAECRGLVRVERGKRTWHYWWLTKRKTGEILGSGYLLIPLVVYDFSNFHLGIVFVASTDNACVGPLAFGGVVMTIITQE